MAMRKAGQGAHSGPGRDWAWEKAGKDRTTRGSEGTGCPRAEARPEEEETPAAQGATPLQVMPGELCSSGGPFPDDGSGHPQGRPAFFLLVGVTSQHLLTGRAGLCVRTPTLPWTLPYSSPSPPHRWVCCPLLSTSPTAENITRPPLLLSGYLLEKGRMRLGDYTHLLTAEYPRCFCTS